LVTSIFPMIRSQTGSIQAPHVLTHAWSSVGSSDRYSSQFSGRWKGRCFMNAM
jgi:hypothetical protein